MANELDELNDYVNEEGRDINVIQKQIKVTVGWGSKFFEILLWVLLIIPGVIFLFQKIEAKNYFQKLQQKLQHDASQIDNYLEQRVVILTNAAKLLDKAIDLDKSTLTQIAAYRSGASLDDAERNNVASMADNVAAKINVAMENYPDLEAHKAIADAMQQNAYLQREITAAREVYNDTVNTWNTAIFSWPVKQIVAAEQGYTTRIPFSTSKEIKQKAREVLF